MLAPPVYKMLSHDKYNVAWISALLLSVTHCASTSSRRKSKQSKQLVKTYKTILAVLDAKKNSCIPRCQNYIVVSYNKTLVLLSHSFLRSGTIVTGVHEQGSVGAVMLVASWLRILKVKHLSLWTLYFRYGFRCVSIYSWFHTSMLNIKSPTRRGQPLYGSACAGVGMDTAMTGVRTRHAAAGIHRPSPAQLQL